MQEPRLRGTAIFFALIAVSSLVRPPLCAAELEFQGKTATQWLDLLTSHDDAQREAAVKAIASDPKGAKLVLGEFVQLWAEQTERQSRLQETLTSLGPSAVPTLLNGLLSPHFDVRQASFAALRFTGVPASDLALSLVRLLPKLDDVDQELAMIAIKDFGQPAIPALIEASRYQGRSAWHVHEVAVRLLRAHVGDSKPVVQAFIERLDDASPDVRSITANALGSALPSEQPAVVQSLRKLALSDSQSKVRDAARNSLKELAFPHATEILPELEVLRTLGGLYDTDMNIVRQAIVEAGHLGTAADRAQPMLIAKLADPDFATRSLAAAALALISHRDDSLRIIVEGVRKGEVLKPRVVELLVEYGPAAAPMLLDAERRDVGAQSQLSRSIDKIVIRSSDLPELRKLAAHNVPYVRVWALRKLLQAQDQSLETLTALAKQMADADRIVRDRAFLDMMDLGQAGVPALIEVCQGKSPAVRRKAVYAMTVIGQPSSDAVDALVRALDDEDEMVRFWACIALGRVKDQQTRLAPLLTARQTDSSEKVRTAARNAFQQLTLTDADR